MFRKIFLLTCLGLILNFNTAIAATIDGDIVLASGKAKAATSVILRDGAGGKHQARSDEKGHFAFTDIAPGSYTIEAIQEEKVIASATVTVVGKDDALQDIKVQDSKALRVVIAQRHDEVHKNLSPSTGANAYVINAEAIESLPQGGVTSFDKVLEQTPGVAQDSFGQTHVRGEHANLQYRLNGILLPEGISGFGQVIDSHIIQSSTLLDGALPAQYGFRTAGVIDIQTKTGLAEGGTADLFGGSHGTIAPSVSYSGHVGNADYYVLDSHLSSDLGIENPTGSVKAIHDHTDQDHQFAYGSYALNPYQRVDLIAGNSVGHFQIPNNPNQAGQYGLVGYNGFNSTQLNERQNEVNQYATLAWQAQRGDLTLQLAPYIRNSTLTYRPDQAGDLIFNGIASDISRSNLAEGLQGDGSYRLGSSHTLRAGFLAQHETAVTNNTSTVFPGGFGFQTSNTPLTVVDNTYKDGLIYGLYAQDEWHLTTALTMNYGARFDVVDAYTHENQISPRLGFVYKATDTTTLHAGYAETFTPPALELISGSTVNKFTGTTGTPPGTGNGAVQAERSHSFDTGVTQKLTNEVQVGLDGYYKIVRNLLDEGQFGQALIYTPFNYAHGHIYGLEATATYAHEKLHTYTNFAVSRAMGKNITSGQFNFDPMELAYINSHFVHLDHDQTYTASLGASYEILPRTEASIDTVVGSGLRRGFANTSSLPGYAQIDLGLTHDLALVPNEKTAARLSIVNLLNESYELRDGSGIGVGAPQYGPRRGIFLGLSQSF